MAKVVIGGGEFIAKGKGTQNKGWLAMTRNEKTNTANNKAENVLPSLSKGESVECIDSQLLEKQTSPPKHFTDATLLGAMTGIGRYVQDSKINKRLNETDGLGTEATRASIIDLLFRRQFMHKIGKEIHATETGKALINALPSETTHPDMTAIWEANLDKIAQRQLRYEAFMQPLTESIAQLISASQQLDTTHFVGLKSARPARKKRFFHKKS